MTWALVADSSCDIADEHREALDIPLTIIPFSFDIDGQEFVDDDNLDISAMLDAMESSPNASRSACPSPGAFTEQYEKADNVIAFTISSKLSGSYNSAVIARDLVLKEHPGKNVFVLDSRSTGPIVGECVKKARELIRAGHSFDQVTATLQKYCLGLRTVFALCSFNNLVKNGRMHKVAGLIAGKLRLWGIGIGDEGAIKIKGKARGVARMLDIVIKDMKERGFAGGAVAISHCQNPEVSTQLKQRIVETWSTAQVELLETRGLCSFYAERKGLIISY